MDLTLALLPTVCGMVCSPEHLGSCMVHTHMLNKVVRTVTVNIHFNQNGCLFRVYTTITSLSHQLVLFHFFRSKLQAFSNFLRFFFFFFKSIPHWGNDSVNNRYAGTDDLLYNPVMDCWTQLIGSYNIQHVNVVNVKI